MKMDIFNKSKLKEVKQRMSCITQSFHHEDALIILTLPILSSRYSATNVYAVTHMDSVFGWEAMEAEPLFATKPIADTECAVRLAPTGTEGQIGASDC